MMPTVPQVSRISFLFTIFTQQPHLHLANFLEIEVTSPRTHGVGNKRFTDYEVRMRTNLPAFKIKEFRCRRRYSDFVWLRTEIKRAVQVIRQNKEMS